MERIERWFQSAARRQQRMIALYPCLLRNRLLPYFVFRLRYLFSLQIIGFAVHVAEFLVLLAYAPKLGLILVVLLRAGSPLVRGAWWGAMEVLRERLREIHGANVKSRAEQEIASWLFLSVILATLVALAGVGWLVWSSSSATTDNTLLIDIYILLIVAELATRIPILTLHSGIYATRRIYRPYWSVLLPTVTQGVVIAVLFVPFQEGALIIAILASSACSLAINYVYIKRMYRIVDLQPKLRQSTRQFGRFVAGLPIVALLWSSTAGFLIRLDGLLILVLVGLEGVAGDTIDLTAGHPEWNTPDLGILLYLIMPAIRGSYEWSILFYFDFVRLRRAVVLRDLAHVFMAKLVFAAAAVGLFFWVMAAVVFLIGFSDIPVAFLLAMVPLFLVRAWLAVYQVRAFADGRFAVVCISIAIVLAGIVVIGTGGFADIGSFIELKICLLIALVYLIAVQVWYDRHEVLAAPFLSLGDWCRKLSDETGGVRVGLLTIAGSATDKNRTVIRATLQDSLNDRGYCAWCDHRSLVYVQRSGRDDVSWFDPYDFFEITAGLITEVRSVPDTLENGRQALDMLRERDILPVPPVESIGASQLVGAFDKLFADGVMVDLASARRAKASAQLDGETATAAIPLSMRALRSGAPFAWCGNYRLYPVFRDQKLRFMFFVPKDVEPSALSEWSQSLSGWSLSQPDQAGAG